MKRSDDTVRSEPTTELGPDPDDPASTVTLPDGALNGGCYVEGPETHRRTALLHDWCVQWAEAGHGFCYIHPRGPEPRELLARLPEDCLDDVVWIDIDRSNCSSQLDVPELQRVAIDPFDAPSPKVDYAIEPVKLRVNAYLDAYTENRQSFDWTVASLLTSLLPPLMRSDDLSHAELARTLDEVRLEESLDRLYELDPFTELDRDGEGDDDRHFDQYPESDPDFDLGMYPIEIALARERRPFLHAASQLREPLDAYPSNPLLGDTSYDPATAVRDGHIILITGGVPSEDGRFTGIERTVGTYLLVAAVCCRLWESAQIRTTAPTYPLVIDGLDALTAGDGDLLRKLLAHTETPLAPVFCGPDTSALDQPVQIAIGDHVDTRVVVTEQSVQPHSQAGTADRESERDDSSRGLPSALLTGSLDALERYLEHEEANAVAEGPLCWLRTDAAGRLAGPDDVQQPMQPTVAPEMPEPRRSPDAVGEAITRSVERYGAEPTWMSPEMKADARERGRDQ